MRNRYGILAFVGCWVVVMGLWYLQGGYALRFLAVAMGVVTLYAVLVPLCVLRNLHVSRELERDRIFAGDAVRVTVRIRQRSLFPPLWFMATDEWRTTDGRLAGRYRRWFWAWNAATDCEYQYEICNMPRGKYKFTGLHFASGDLFGLAVKMKRVSSNEAHHHEWIVYPRPLAGRFATTRVSGVSALVGGVRDYASGDPLSRIHWKSSARAASLKIKEPDTEATKRMMVVLDNERRPFEAESSQRFEMSVRAAAAVMQYARESGINAELFCGLDVQLPNDGDSLTQLAMIQADGRLPLYAVLQRAATAISPDSEVVCLAVRPDAVTIQAVHQLCRKRAQVTVYYLYDAVSLTWPARQFLRELETLGCRTFAIPCKMDHTDMVAGGMNDVGA